MLRYLKFGQNRQAGWFAAQLFFNIAALGGKTVVRETVRINYPLGKFSWIRRNSEGGLGSVALLESD